MILRFLTHGLLGLILAAKPSAAEESSYIPSETVEGYLTAFSLSGKRVPLVAPGLPFAWVNEGRSLFSAGGSRGVENVDLVSLRTELVAGTESLWGIRSIAVSPTRDRIFVSSNLGDYLHMQSAVVQFDVSTRKQVVLVSDPARKYIWARLAVSPDGQHLFAERQVVGITSSPKFKVELELIDVASRSVKSLGSGYSSAAWSPDGMWVAAVQAGPRAHLVLLDPLKMKIKRSLGLVANDEIEWSPDSKRLLVSRFQFRCGAYATTLFAIEADTGRGAEVSGSNCAVMTTGTAGWINSEAFRAAVLRLRTQEISK